MTISPANADVEGDSVRTAALWAEAEASAEVAAEVADDDDRRIAFEDAEICKGGRAVNRGEDYQMHEKKKEDGKQQMQGTTNHEKI